MQKTFNFESGEILLIDKPIEWTSFDAVRKIKNALSRQGFRKLKIGHAGTLDPKASGLLLICTGKKTKEIESLQNQPKEYTGTIFFGATRPSFDHETEIDETFPAEHLSLAFLREKALLFTGEIQQTPPVFSAIKVDGVRAYTHARKGNDLEIKSRPVTVSQFEISSFENSLATFKVVCSKGTYIRSLANDLGKACGSGAYLNSLVRTAIGDFRVEDAITPQAFTDLLNPTV